MAKELLGKDFAGTVDFSLPFPVAGAYTTLAAGVEQTTVTPPNFNRAFFSFAVGTNVFVKQGTTAVTLPGGAFSSTTTELNPAVRQIDINGGQTLRFISDTTSYVQIRYDLGQDSVKYV